MAPTSKQELGRRGEKAVRDHVPCPNCRRPKHLTPLIQNFPCADLICAFCGFLAQVKARNITGSRTPTRILGGDWMRQHDQIVAGIFQPLFICSFEAGALRSIDYIPAHILQATPEVYVPRRPLAETAKRAGWQGFYYDLARLPAIGIRRVYGE